MHPEDSEEQIERSREENKNVALQMKWKFYELEQNFNVQYIDHISNYMIIRPICMFFLNM